MSKVYLASASADRAIAEKLVALLRERGIDVLSISDVPPGVNFADWISASIRESDKVLVLWSDATLGAAHLHREASLACASGKLIPVLLGTTAPAEFLEISAVDLAGWSGEVRDPRFDDLVRALRRGMPIGAATPNARDDHRPPPRVDSGDSTLAGPVPSPMRQPPAVGSAPRPPSCPPMGESTVQPRAQTTPVPPPRPPPSAGSRASGGLLGRAVERFRDFFASRKSEPETPLERTNTGATPSRSAPLPEALEPVWLGASAPRQCTRGQRFTAALVAYIEAARESAKEKLTALGESGDRVVMDVAPQRNASWRIGAPVVVRLTGDGVDLTPVEIAFDWSGRENLAAFAVRVRDDAPATISLAFETFVAGVPVAFLPMNVTVATRPAPLVAQEAQASLPSTVFASYSSKDAQSVTQRLSTLVRWSPGLDIFQDCLDLQPNKLFQPQIKVEISRRDVFLLFWSRNAAASQWVQWEYRTARDTRGPDAILPMPLEDPAIAPPPADLDDRHFRDRFMLAGYGLAKIRDEATRPPA
jgi:hypothetical protein